MKILKETFFERLRNRLGPGNAIKTLRVLRRASQKGSFDYMVIKEASELLDRYRLEARVSIHVFRNWQVRRAVSDTLAPLKDQEGRILLESARASASLYLDAARDYRDLYRMAMESTLENGWNAANDK